MKTTIASLLLLLVNLFFVFSKKIKKTETNVKEMTDEELNEAIYSRIQKNQCFSIACFL